MQADKRKYPDVRTIFEKELGSELAASFPDKMDDALSPELLQFFHTSTTDDFSSDGRYIKFMGKIEPLLKNEPYVKVSVRVVDENNRPLKDSVVQLAQMKDLEHSGEMRTYANDFKQYKRKRLTDNDGKFLFTDVPNFSFPWLSHYFSYGQIPENNLRLTVQRPGYKTVRRYLLNVDKKILALTAHLILWQWRAAEKFPPELKKKMPPLPRKKLNILSENKEEIIVIKIVLQKEVDGVKTSKSKYSAPKTVSGGKN
jgi:hypothetical protein